TLIISILVLGGLATAIFLFYRQGVRQAGQPPQAVGTPVAGIKTPPPAEAQPTDPAAGLSIYKTEGGQSSPAQPPQPTFTPAPEQPARRAEAQGAPAVVVAPPTARQAGPGCAEAADAAAVRQDRGHSARQDRRRRAGAGQAEDPACAGQVRGR